MHWIFAALLLAALLGQRFLGLSYRISLLVIALAVVGLALVSLMQIKQSYGFALGLAPLLFSLVFVYRGATHPPIADVATRWDPVVPYLTEVDQISDNPLIVTPAMLDAHNGAFSDLRSLTLAAHPETQVKQIGQQLGWRVTAEQDDAIQFEVESVLLGFIDDVVVRWNEGPEGWRVDARSRSRVGVSDLGANAQRLRQFFNQLSKRTST